MSIKNDMSWWTKHFVETRLERLNRIKSEDWLVEKQKEWKIKNKVQRTSPQLQDRSDYKTDLAFTVKTTKDAELLAWMPEYNFIPLDGESRKKVKILKHIWKYWWLVSKTDRVLSKVIPSATAYWTWVMYEWLKTIYKKIKEPSYDDEWKITFKEKTVVDYSWVYSEYIPFENFFADWVDIDSANEVIWIKYWDRTDFINEHELNPLYSNLNDIPSSKEYTLVQWVDDPKHDMETDEVITEIRYYNKSKDMFIILANGVEVYNTPIPFSHKELPFCIFVDYEVDWRFYWMWEYELLEEDEEFADALRSLDLDVVLAQMWTVLVEEDLDMDEAQFEYWTNTFVRVDDVNRVKHFSPNISSNWISNAQQKLDDTVVSKTWVNHRAQTLDPSETATKTAAKSQAARKRINLNLKINWYYFFERLARLRLANLKLFHSKWKKEIFIEGWDINKDWIFTPVNWWYGSFTITPEFLEGEYSIIPITESILWSSEERNKQNFLEFVQVMAPIAWADWKPVIKWEKIVEQWADIWWFDLDKLTSSVSAEKSADQLVSDAMKENRWVSTDSTEPTSPDYIPPEQRSWAAAKWLSWSAKIKDSDILW